MELSKQYVDILVTLRKTGLIEYRNFPNASKLKEELEYLIEKGYIYATYRNDDNVRIIWLTKDSENYLDVLQERKTKDLEDAEYRHRQENNESEYRKNNNKIENDRFNTNKKLSIYQILIAGITLLCTLATIGVAIATLVFTIG